MTDAFEFYLNLINMTSRLDRSLLPTSSVYLADVLRERNGDVNLTVNYRQTDTHTDRHTMAHTVTHRDNTHTHTHTHTHTAPISLQYFELILRTPL
eukprot:SAG11_NODE_2863_length_2896_cov_15.888809_2_plen_96_part_00